MATSIPWENNYQRTYKITVGTHGYIKQDYIVPASIASPDFELPSSATETIPSNAVVIDNLTDPRGFTFRFESQQVASNKGSDAEKSYLELYNLSDEVVAIINSANCVCIIECGYEGKTTLCYTGNVVSVTPLKSPPDVKYKIQLSASGTSVRNTTINTHYDEGMSTADIILDMAQRFPATAIATYGLEAHQDKYKTGGTGVTGDLITNFDAYLKKKGLEYTFSNNKIYIIPYRLLPDDVSSFSRTNFTLSEGSIKNVSQSSNNSGVSNADINSKIKKLQINTFFLPIEVGQLVTIPDGENLNDYSGTYIVKGRRVILESKGNAWDVVLEVEQIPN